MYKRSEISSTLNVDDPGFTGFFECRSASECESWTGTRPNSQFFGFLNLETTDGLALLQLAGSNKNGFYIRGNQGANVTCNGLSWGKICTATFSLSGTTLTITN